MDLLESIAPQLYIIVLGKKTHDGFREARKVTVDLEDNAYSKKGKTYDYKPEYFQHHRGRRHYAYYDIDTQEHLKHDWVESSDVNAEDSDTRNARGLVRTAIQNATSSYGLAMVILAGAAGLGGGLFIGYLLAGAM